MVRFSLAQNNIPLFLCALLLSAAWAAVIRYPSVGNLLKQRAEICMLEFWRLPAGSGQNGSLGLGFWSTSPVGQQQLGAFFELTQAGGNEGRVQRTRLLSVGSGASSPGIYPMILRAQPGHFRLQAIRAWLHE